MLPQNTQEFFSIPFVDFEAVLLNLVLLPILYRTHALDWNDINAITVFFHGSVANTIRTKHAQSIISPILTVDIFQSTDREIII